MPKSKPSFTTAVIVILLLANARKLCNHYRIWRLRRVILISLLNRLASDIGSVEEPFCVLFVELAVDGVLGFFDGVCCGN